MKHRSPLSGLLYWIADDAVLAATFEHGKWHGKLAYLNIGRRTRRFTKTTSLEFLIARAKARYRRSLPDPSASTKQDRKGVATTNPGSNSPATGGNPG